MSLNARRHARVRDVNNQSNQGLNYHPRRPRNAVGPKGQGFHCCWERQILTLGAKTLPGQGAHVVISAGDQNLKLRH